MRSPHLAYDHGDDVSARIGADDSGFFESPRPRLLHEISGIKPEPRGVHVLLEDHGVRSAQRVALGDIGGAIVVGLWPAELKRQAGYLYSDGRGKAMVAAARQLGWDVRPSPHLAFFNSAPVLRLYMAPDLDAEVYAERWEGADGRLIGQHSAEDVRQQLWPWLKQRGYASAKDDEVLEQFLAVLGRRKAHLRPGMRFRRRWEGAEIDRLGQSRLSATVRAEVNAILQAVGDPPLPAPAQI
jgi:hypothetical protein